MRLLIFENFIIYKKDINFQKSRRISNQENPVLKDGAIEYQSINTLSYIELTFVYAKLVF
jgi:hypothetical protein